MRLCLVLISTVLFAWPANGQAPGQTNPLSLTVGQQIRVHTPDEPNEMVLGTVSLVERDRLSFFTERTPEPVVLLYADIDTIAVRRRIPTESAKFAGGMGMFLGSAVGVIAAPFVAAALPMNTGTAIAVFGAGGAATGTLVGAAVGALFVPPRWYLHVLR